MGAHGNLKGDGLLRNGIALVVAEDDLEYLFEREVVAEVEAKSPCDVVLNGIDYRLEVHPAPLLRPQHQCPLQAVAKSPTALAK